MLAGADPVDTGAVGAPVAAPSMIEVDWEWLLAKMANPRLVIKNPAAKIPVVRVNKSPAARPVINPPPLLPPIPKAPPSLR